MKNVVITGSAGMIYESQIAEAGMLKQGHGFMAAGLREDRLI